MRKSQTLGVGILAALALANAGTVQAASTATDAGAASVYTQTIAHGAAIAAMQAQTHELPRAFVACVLAGTDTYTAELTGRTCVAPDGEVWYAGIRAYADGTSAFVTGP